jgi:Spy/CpxP family protein refolding chaperone
VRNWKPIAAVLLIFAAGFTTGALVVREKARRNFVVFRDDRRFPDPPPGPPGGGRMGAFRTNFIEQMKRDLDLTPQQATEIEKVMREGHERMAKIWEPVEPQAKEEFRLTREKIDALLTPEQLAKFKEPFRRREKGPGGPGGPGDWKHGPRERHGGEPSRRPE